MLILAIDTTSAVGGVGIFRDAECLASVPHAGPADGYSIALFEMVEQALVQAHLELREIELYAAANGPGSFTGIRVGLAAARAWANVFTRPVRGVSVLEAMANTQGLGAGGWTLGGSDPEWCFSILDARRGEFYLGSFQRKSSEVPEAAMPEYEAVDEGWVVKPEALRTLLPERAAAGGGATCLVRAHDRAAIELCASLPPPLNWRQIEGVLVDAIAAIAASEQRAGGPCPSAKLDAYYMRRPDAEVNWKG
jgi:tRNA threonylcarbamoyladenosine biosynthesis protein TsaB